MDATFRSPDDPMPRGEPPIVCVRGTPFEMGVEHGRQLGAVIRAALQAAASLPNWRALVRDVSEERLNACWGPSGAEELSGIAEAAGVSLPELAAFNQLLYEAIQGGAHFALCAESNSGYGLIHAANEDLRLPEPLGAALGRVVFVRQPADGFASVTLGVAGQIGCQSGINAHGLSITSTRLVDLEMPAAPAKRLHTVLVQQMLESAEEIDAAAALYRDEPGDTPYTLLLADVRADRLCHIEYDMVLQKILPWAPDVIAANHRLMRTVPGEPPSPSRERTARLRELLGSDGPAPTSPLAAMRVLRDRVPVSGIVGSEICTADNQVSVLFQPAAGTLWVTYGPRESVARDAFCELDLRALLPGFAQAAEGQAAAEALLPAVPLAGAASADRLPLIDAVPQHEPPVRVIAESRVEPLRDVFLVEHRFKDRPMMPLVVMVEMLAEAAALLAGPGRRVTGVRNVEIINGLRFQSDEMHAVKIEAIAAGPEVTCLLTCDVKNRRGDVLLKDKPHLRGVVELADASTPPSVPAGTSAPSAPDRARWVRCFYTENIVIHHGPVFRCLRALVVDGDYSWGEIVPLPLSRIAGHRRRDGWFTNPTLLDACLYACGSTLWLKNRGIIAVPDGIERLWFGRFPRPNEKCVITMRDRGREGNCTSYDFTAVGEDGEVLVDVAEYRNRIVAEEPARPASETGAVAP